MSIAKNKLEKYRQLDKPKPLKTQLDYVKAENAMSLKKIDEKSDEEFNSSPPGIFE